MKFLFNPTCNVIQSKHDVITDRFINGLISWEDYEKYNNAYEQWKHLFTLNLN